MNCPEMNPLLHAYVDGELDLMRSLEVERHLKSCANCIAAKRSLQSLHSTLRHNDLSYSAPASLRRRLLTEVGKSSSETQRRGSTPWIWQWLAIGAIGFAALTLMFRPVGISERDRIAEEAVSSHVRSLMVGHLTDVASSNQHTVKPWFNGKIDFAPNVKDFAAQGFPLIGGRLDYLDGQTVAALVYQRTPQTTNGIPPTINVFVWPAKNARTEATESLRGYNIINRDIADLHYYIVSDLNAKELTEFANLLGQ